jgi:hypothetical protein
LIKKNRKKKSDRLESSYTGKDNASFVDVMSMKRTLSMFLLMMMLFPLAGCKETLNGVDELIEKAREEIPIAEADTVELRYAGACEDGDSVLFWFISGNEYQAHYYLPMECKAKGNGGYRFIRTYKPMARACDIAVLNWNRGYCFLINNPNCKAVEITDSTGVREISIEEDCYPSIIFNEEIPFEYLFLDENGNDISMKTTFRTVGYAFRCTPSDGKYHSGLLL